MGSEIEPHITKAWEETPDKQDGTTRPKVGRPTDYYPEVCDEMLSFFSIPHVAIEEITIQFKNGTKKTLQKAVANQLPTFERFSVQVGVDRGILNDWAKKYPEFHLTYKKCKELQKDMLVDLAQRGLYNPTFSIFVAKNITDMRDVIVQKTEEDSPLDKVDLSKYSDEELDNLQKLIRKGLPTGESEKVGTAD